MLPFLSKKAHMALCHMCDAVIGLMVLYGILRPFWLEWYVHVNENFFIHIYTFQFRQVSNIDEILFSLYFIRYGFVHVTCDVYALSNAQCLYKLLLLSHRILYSHYILFWFVTFNLFFHNIIFEVLWWKSPHSCTAEFRGVFCCLVSIFVSE